MRLRKLAILNFKNIEELTLEFNLGINALVGGNGAGKTNILDAIHYLSMCKSSLAMTDQQSVRHGADFFMLDGAYTMDDGKSEGIVCSYARAGGKSLKRNGKEYDRLSEHIGLLPLVIVSPSDTFLISDSAEERRRYLNSFISQLDRDYLNALIRYNQLLGERNKLLKQHDQNPELLDVIDMQMVRWGGVVYEKRKDVIAQMAPIVAMYYRELSDDREQVELTYRSELSTGDFAELLKQAYEKDRMNGFSACGVHRDDMRMKIGGYQLRKYGSQGQQKSFLIALKLAQFMIVTQHRNERPVLLLDDLFDKLDLHRVERLISMFGREEFGQIFITDCNNARLKRILDESKFDYSLFNISDGDVVPEDENMKENEEN